MSIVEAIEVLRERYDRFALALEGLTFGEDASSMVNRAVAKTLREVRADLTYLHNVIEQERKAPKDSS